MLLSCIDTSFLVLDVALRIMNRFVTQRSLWPVPKADTWPNKQSVSTYQAAEDAALHGACWLYILRLRTLSISTSWFEWMDCLYNFAHYFYTMPACYNMSDVRDVFCVMP